MVVAAEDAERFLAGAAAENIEATVVAHVSAEPRLRMSWRGKTIVDIARSFLASNGAEKHARVSVPAPAAGRRQRGGARPRFSRRTSARTTRCASGWRS